MEENDDKLKVIILMHESTELKFITVNTIIILLGSRFAADISNHRCTLGGDL